MFKRSRFLITAVGHSSAPKGIEDIPGLEQFKGDVVFTSKWRDIEFVNKNVVFIGNGASANQVLTWLMNEAQVSNLVHIYRQPQWYMPKANPAVSSFRKWLYRTVPFAQRINRWISMLTIEPLVLVMSSSSIGTYMRQGLEGYLLKYIKASPKKYHERLTPSYPVLTKRPIFDHGYIECTKRHNFNLVQGNGIKGVTKDGRGIIDPEGKVHNNVDVVVVASGFYSSTMIAPMQIFGDDGLELKEHWKRVESIRAYMAVAVSAFPNLFMLGGPHGFINGTQFLSAECTADYILRLLIKFFPSSGPMPTVSTIRVKASAESAYDAEMKRRVQSLVVSGCHGGATEGKEAITGWWVDKTTGKNFMNWPGTQTEYWWTRCVKAVKWQDWTMESD